MNAVITCGVTIGDNVIIGAGIAGLSAAKAIREADRHGKIDIFTKENNLPYSRPMLTKAPFISFDPARWTIYNQDWFDANNITIHIDERLSKIDFLPQKIIRANLLCFLILNLDSISKQQMYLRLYCLQVDGD